MHFKNFISFFRHLGLGVSNQTQYLTHPPNPANLAQEPADPTPVTVGGGSLIPNSKTGGLVDGLEHGKSISTNLTRKHIGNSFLCWLKLFVGMIFSDLIEIRQDLIKIWPDLFEIHQDLAGSLQNWASSHWDLPRSLQVRPNLIEISQDLFKIRLDLAKISIFRQKSGVIRIVRAQPENFDVRPPELFPVVGWQRVHV